MSVALSGYDSPVVFNLRPTFLKGSPHMMSVLGTLFIGLVAGFIARAIKPGDDGMGWIMTAVLGVAGSFLASYGGAAIGLYAPGQAAGFIASVLGAVILLVVYGFIRKKSA
jgi:uncharacterized membrane protein YeaQ/YmgE (transglycosylase-associated protein family)